MYSQWRRGVKVSAEKETKREKKVERDKENPSIGEYSHLNVNAQIPIPPFNLPKPIQISQNGNKH